MNKITLLLCAVAMMGFAQNPETNNTANWTVTKLANTNQLVTNPYDIKEGPDGWLWVTERRSITINMTALTGERLVRINPVSGVKQVMIDLNTKVYSSAGQDGLMGFAIHPDLFVNPTTAVNNYVYMAYTYAQGAANDANRRLRISRFTYNHVTATLDTNSELILIEGLSGSNDHHSGKLAISPIDNKLYYSSGDLGANQFSNRCNIIQSQALPSAADMVSGAFRQTYQGKMLRFNLDGSIPSDNPLFAPFTPTNTDPGPVNNNIADNLKVRSHIYSFGHRNAQGVDFAPDGTMYSSEHGDRVDDELNIIEAGKNYGWPLNVGFFDNAGYEYCIVGSVSGCNTSTQCTAASARFPEMSRGTAADFVGPIATYNSTSATAPTGDFLSWPSVAPSGIEYYQTNNSTNAIPWAKSLLIPTLKKGTIYRYDLDASGSAVTSNLIEFHSSIDRYREVIVSRDGTTIYAITDSQGTTSGPSGSSGLTLQNPGAIIVIKYTPAAEPTNRVNGFTATGATGKITLNWTDAAAGSAPAGGYLIKASTGTLASITNPIDGVMDAEDADLSDGSALVYVNPGVQTYTFNGLTNATIHNFKIYSFSNTGAAIDYKTNQFRSASATPQAIPTLVISEVVSYSGTQTTPNLGDRNQMNFVEIYNYGNTAIDLNTTQVYLARQRAGTADRFELLLTGTIQPKQYMIIGRSTYNTQAVFYAPGTTADLIGSNDLLGGDGDDPYLLTINGSFVGNNFDVLDILGELGVDGTGLAWDYTNKRFYRNRFATSNSTFTPSEWLNQDILPATMSITPGRGETVSFVYDNNTWTPANPAGNTVSGDFVSVVNGTAVLSGPITAGNLSIDNGDTLDLNGHDLTIAGGSGFMFINGSLLGSNSTLIVSAGSRVEHRQGNTPLNFQNIDLSESTLANQLDAPSVTITGILKMNNQQLTVNNLILKSTATSTAMIDVVPVGGSINASMGVTSERFIPAKRAFRFVSSPVTTTSSINTNWQESGSSAAGLGTHITGSSTGANGFDQTASGAASLFSFNNTTQAWTAAVNTNTATLNAGTPYRLFVRGDRTTDLNSNTAAASNTTLRMTGSPRIGSTTVTGLGNVAGNFNFIGNPYQAPVNMSAVLAASTNVNANFVYYWDPTLNARGAYTTLNIPTNTAVPASSFNSFAQPHTAFFVTTLNNGSATVNFNESQKDVSQQVLNVFSTPATMGIVNVQLFEEAEFNAGARERDAAVVLLSTTGNDAVDANDAIKLTNLDENIAVATSGSLLSIENRSAAQDGTIIQLNNTAYRATQYVLKATVTNITTPAYIYDAFTQEYTPLTTGSAAYAFSVNAANAASVNASRFQIVFSSVTLSNGSDILASSNVRVYPNPTTDRTINIAGLNAQEEVRLFNIVGQEISLGSSATQFNGQTLTIALPQSIAKGTYLLRIGSANNALTEKIIVE